MRDFLSNLKATVQNYFENYVLLNFQGRVR